MRNHIPSEEIIAARLSLGLTRNQLAAAIGVTNGAVYNWENDRCGIQKRHYHKLRALLQLDEEERGEDDTAAPADDQEEGATVRLDIPDFMFGHLQEAADRGFRTIENQVLWFIQRGLEVGDE